MVYKKETGETFKIPHRDYQKLVTTHKIGSGSDQPFEDFKEVMEFYPKKQVPTIFRDSGENHIEGMHWDLIPRWFLNKDGLTVSEVVKKKNSRKKVDGKSIGFSSFNVRSETMATKPTFRSPWNEGKRCIFPNIISFKERPDFYRNKEFEIKLSHPIIMGGIYDVWKSKDGEELHSCTLITLSGKNHQLMEKIPHDRMPLILEEDQIDEWLSEHTSPSQAFEMIQQYSAEKMSLT